MERKENVVPIDNVAWFQVGLDSIRRCWAKESLETLFGRSLLAVFKINKTKNRTSHECVIQNPVFEAESHAITPFMCPVGVLPALIFL
jgi:hypothetical protein